MYPKLFKKQWLFLLLLLLGVTTPGFADDPFKMGLVTPEDLKMTTYAPDTSAAAVVLYDMGESSFMFTSGVQLQFKRIMRIKILKKSGLNEADIVIPFYKKGDGNKEEVLNVKGFTYNWENGAMVKMKLEEKAIFEEKQDANWHLKKLTMPGVRVGSVIELTYTIKSDFLQFLREWEFQRPIPVKWSEYRVGMVPFYEYKQVLHGFHPFHIKDAKVERKTAALVQNRQAHIVNVEERGTISMQVVQYRWVMKDVPAMAEEPYLPNMRDYMAKLEFELSKVQYPDEQPIYTSGDWESFTKELLKDESFGKQLDNTTFLAKTAHELVAGKDDTLSKVKAVVTHVKEHMRWDGKHRIYAENLRKSYDRRTGSSSEVNLLLTAMLREAGIRAMPMLVSTRQHGKPLTSSPMISKFDYVISYVSVGGINYLLDATEASLPFGMLPFRCLNDQGWVVQQPAGKWVPLMGLEKNLQVVSGQLKIKATGEVSGILSESYQGVPAVSARSAVKEKGEETYLKEFANAGTDWIRAAVKLSNLDNLQKPFGKEYELNRAGEDQPVDLLYVSPMLTHAQGENPFKLTTRQYPIDFAAPVDETYFFTYQLPEGYVPETLPAPAILTLPRNAAKFTYVVQAQNGQLQITSKLNINKTFFTPEEYGNLREFFSRIVAKHAEKVVLKKKS
ncbi:DUF3857 domain-containing protein [Rufibacter immobilis]|uniref:DUF3857 domain-containing protein n=1 Tax=Rufibacter immobilis TaxID=1348778 RepID=A0A3M9MXP3_9BACT|nr:DUF3857 domain-containing protein [Rufibacter immobilis]RNI30322.1 DUF3857 domain-containing protein [Rufibacter immobilis]